MPKLKDMWPLLAAGGVGAALLLKGGLGGGNCGTCKGSGKEKVGDQAGRKCRTCGGSGQLPSNETLSGQPTEQSVEQLKNIMQIRGLQPEGPGLAVDSANRDPKNYMGQ